MRADSGDRVAIKLADEVDAIKAGLGVAAIPVREHIRCDQIADPSADSPGVLFFRVTDAKAVVGCKIPTWPWAIPTS